MVEQSFFMSSKAELTVAVTERKSGFRLLTGLQRRTTIAWPDAESERTGRIFIMKRKAISMILTAAMVSAMLAGCGSEKAETEAPAAETAAETEVSEETEAAETTEAVTEAADGDTASTDGTFTVGFDQDFPPMGFVGDDGEFTGFDLEMAAEVAKRQNLEIAYQPISWDAKDMELDAGTIDCIWNGFTMNGREDDYTWTESYMDNSQVFVVKSDSGIKTHEDLAGKIVTAQTDSAALNALNGDDFKDLKGSFKELLTCAQYNTAFMDLEAGAVDAVAMDIGVAKYQIEGKESQYTILEKPIIEEQYGVGFYKGNTEMRDKVQKALDDMAADGTFKTISEKWFGYDVCTLAAEKKTTESN